MRYRTAAILSVALVGGMFGLPVVIKAAFLPSLRQGLPVPGYEKILLEVAIFCLRFSWLLALPITVVLFTVAGLTHPLELGARKRMPSLR